MSTNFLRLEEAENGIFILTFNRPKALNALSAELIQELHKLIVDSTNNRSTAHL
tara:strand:- start:1356 stop:1517 length:162 start_codon:yes stop_codon:yes gene_type:complete